jgi:hypothetical protein
MMRSRILLSILVSVIALATPAASQVYIHNQGDAAAVTKAREGLTESRNAFLAAFDENNRTLAELMASERMAAFNSQLARRDYELASVLDLVSVRNNIRDTSAAVRELARLVDERQRVIVATPPPWSHDQAATLHSRLRFAAAQRRRLIDAIAQRDNSMAEYRQLGGRRGRPCDDDGTGAIAPPQDTPPEAMGRFRNAQGFCESIIRHRQAERAAFADLTPALAAGIGATPDPATLPPGELRGAVAERQNVAELVKTQDRLAKSAREYLERSERYLTCLQRQANEPGLQAQVNEAAKRLGDFLKWLQEDLDKELAGQTTPAAATPAVNLQPCTPPDGPTIAPPPAVASVEQLDQAVAEPGAGPAGSDRLRLADIQRLIQGASRFEPTRSIVAGAQEEVQEFRESLAGRILAGLASPDLNDPEQREATIASNVLRILQAAQSLQMDRRPNVSGVLIDVAAARLRSETARIEGERLRHASTLAGLRVAALSQELLLLARAQAELARPDQDRLLRALRLYGRSWTDFRAPQTVLDLDVVNLEYAAWANRERATAEATFAMLEPALNELNEYGQGGVTPGDIARILNTVGIVALNVEN